MSTGAALAALPILKVSKVCYSFQLKNVFFAVVKSGCFHCFNGYWLIGRVVLDPAVHYLGPRGVGSSYDRHISIGSHICCNR